MGLDREKKEPGEGGERDWSGHQKNKKVSEGHSLAHVASSTQRGKDGGEKGRRSMVVLGDFRQVGHGKSLLDAMSKITQR